MNAPIPFRPARAHGLHLHAANESRQVAMPRRIASESEAVHAARIEAVRRLGAGWSMHPAYTPQPRHSNDPQFYSPARLEFLASIAQRAAIDRARNPAWRRSEAVRLAMSGTVA